MCMNLICWPERWLTWSDTMLEWAMTMDVSVFNSKLLPFQRIFFFSPFGLLIDANWHLPWPILNALLKRKKRAHSLVAHWKRFRFPAINTIIIWINVRGNVLLFDSLQVKSVCAVIGTGVSWPNRLSVWKTFNRINSLNAAKTTISTYCECHTVAAWWTNRMRWVSFSTIESMGELRILVLVVRCW